MRSCTLRYFIRKRFIIKMGKNNADHMKVLYTTSDAVQYSTYDFIRIIREKVNLWDRTHEDFHNREQRKRSWQAVAEQLCRNYHSLKEAEQQELAKALLKRWKNTRDCFLRAYRLQQIGDSRARPYIYEAELMFLVKNRSPSTEGTITDDNAVDDTKVSASKKATQNTQNNAQKRKSNSKPNEIAVENESPKTKRHCLETKADNPVNARVSLLRPRQSSRIVSLSLLKVNQNNEITIDEDFIKMECNAAKSESNIELAEELSSEINDNNDLSNDSVISIITDDGNVETKNLNFNTVKTNDLQNQNIIMNSKCSKILSETMLNDPDQAFFDSVKPHLQKMNDEQKLDFKIEVLSMLRRYKT